MLNKIGIPGTTISFEIVDKNITITNKFDLCGIKGELQ